jgi:hypothetical protein
MDGVMVHSFDGEAWKYFNREYPWFLMESQNIYLRLCIDGFRSYESFGG